MKNNFSKIFAISILSLAIFGAFSRSVFAEETVPNFEEKNTKIAAECKNIKIHLSKLRSSDALKRVNLGQNFEKISNDYMSKMNTKVVLNKLNGANLVAVASEFNQNFISFKEKYQAYERELVKLTGQDCEKNAAEFQNQLEKTREFRKNLNLSVENAKNSAKKYQDELREFSKEVK